MTKMPAAAKRILADGEFCYVAVATRSGPHLTPVVFAMDGGRMWLTTARGSVKARAWKADRRVAGMVRVADRALAFRGTVKVYDALDPFTWPSAVLASPRLGKAATKFSLRNARFFFGYAMDAYRVPLAWAPPGRVFVRVDLAAARLVDLAEGTIEDGWGEWPRGLTAATTFAEPAQPDRLGAEIPASILRAVGESGEGAIATDPGELTVLPAWYELAGGSFEIHMPLPFAQLTKARPRTPAALVIDRASAWRAAEMRGLLVRGQAEAYAPGLTRRGVAALRRRVPDGDALFRLTPDRAVWWEGWTSRTVALARRGKARTG